MTPLPFEGPDLRHFEAAEGWLGLGDHREANTALEEMSPDARAHPLVLELRWKIYAHAGQWEHCVTIAEGLVQALPDHEFGYIHRSFALHELKRTQEAFALLEPHWMRFPRCATIPYNLACYCAQLGRLTECESWFRMAMAIDPEATRATALDDPDLQPLWDSKSGTLWRRD